jgi:flagellar basal-body rod protein FlgB
MSTPITDLTLQSLQGALRGLSARSQAIRDNIANAETPGFLARTVDFESSLARAMQAGNPGAVSVSTGRSSSPTNLSGNNVNVDEEFVAMTETSLRNQLVTEALNAKYRLLRTSITGQ